MLLGGLAVQPPPTRVDLSSLKGVQILVTGWRSTEQVQTLWTKRMRDIGAAIDSCRRTSPTSSSRML